MKKLFPLLVLMVAVYVIYYNLVHKNKSEDMHSATPDITISATELYREFSLDEAAANERFLNKTVVVQGEVFEIAMSKNGMPKLRLQSDDAAFGVQCIFDAQSKHRRQEFHEGEVISLKCICMDYYNDVELTNCVEE